MAAQFWRGVDPVGRRVQVKGRWMQIVGVAQNGQVQQPAGDAASRSSTSRCDRISRLSRPCRSERRRARRRSRRRSCARFMRSTRNIAPGELITMREQVDRTTASQRIAVTILGVFGGLALVLAAIGLYGVMSSTVSQSTRELALRMALGASARDLLRLVMVQGTRADGRRRRARRRGGAGIDASDGISPVQVSPRDPLAFGSAFVGDCRRLAARVLPARLARDADRSARGVARAERRRFLNDGALATRLLTTDDLSGREPVAAMRDTSARIRALAGAWSPAEFERSYAPGKWTARQILTHLAQSEIALGARARMALTTPGYVAQSFDQDKWIARESAMGGPAALDAFLGIGAMNCHSSRRSRRRIATTTLSHPEYGSLTGGLDRPPDGRPPDPSPQAARSDRRRLTTGLCPTGSAPLKRCPTYSASAGHGLQAVPADTDPDHRTSCPKWGGGCPLPHHPAVCDSLAPPHRR